MPVDYSNVDIYGAFSKHLNMGKKKANTHNGEWASYCPFCGGGEDRFLMWPYRDDKTIHYWCRVCGQFGDILNFIEQVEGLPFVEACKVLNIALERMPAGNDKPRRQYSPNDDVAPSEKWQDIAAAFANECKAILWSEAGKNALNWLRKRGLTDETIKRAGLGYNPITRFDDLAMWHIQEQGESKKVWIPRGIVIPWLIDRQIWKINIRRPDADIKADVAQGKPENKYIPVKGGSKGLYGINRFDPELPTVVVEGEFDRLILVQETAGAVNVVATGSIGHGRGEKWALLIAQSSIVLISYDADISGATAAKDYWLEYIPHSLPWQPWMHDINDMHTSGLNVREWLELGLETAGASTSERPAIASLDDLLANRLPAPVEVTSEPAPDAVGASYEACTVEEALALLPDSPTTDDYLALPIEARIALFTAKACGSCGGHSYTFDTDGRLICPCVVVKRRRNLAPVTSYQKAS